MKKIALLLSLIIAFGCMIGCKPTKPGNENLPQPLDPTIEELYKEEEFKYTPQKALHEDEHLSLWFNHAFSKTKQTDTTHTLRHSYRMYMAQNEIEGCQFVLSSANARENLTAKISPFTHEESGEQIKANIYLQYYFEVEKQMQPDALPPLLSPFSIAKDTSQAFLIKVKTLMDTTPGDYSATLQIINASGDEVKVAHVYLRVWDFMLSEESACDTAMDLSRYNIMITHGKDLYKEYYDYLLENRISAYDLPYEYGDKRTEEYLNNPRVSSFNALGWKKGLGYYTETTLKNKIKESYTYLSQNEEWLKKAYFYFVDEPATEEDLDLINKYGHFLKETFPDYRMMAPFFINNKIDSETDYIEYIKEAITVWCPKTFAVTSILDSVEYGDASSIMDYQFEKLYGTFPERMAGYVDEGDELWWYVCWEPSSPFSTLNTEDVGLSHRTLFWQQKINDVTGFLYFMVNEWDNNGWNAHKKLTPSGTVVYGDGQLLYPGNKYDIDGAVGSLRLEAVRDGIEDFEYLSMLEKKIGSNKAKAFANKIAVHVAKWEKDEDIFASTRVMLGNYVQALYNKEI